MDSRVPANGDALISEAAKFGRRAARFYKIFKDNEHPLTINAAHLTSITESRGIPDEINSPYVIATIVSGLAGVTIIIIVMLSIWILKNARPKKAQTNNDSDVEKKQEVTETSKAEVVNKSKEIISITNPTYRMDLNMEFHQEHLTLVVMPKETSV